MIAPPDSTRWYGILAAATLTVAGGGFALVAVGQLTFPGFTESMEGDILQHVERAAHGRPIYPAPGGEYIALAYMPLYYVLASPLFLLFGDSLFGPRLLSVVCAFASAGLIGRIATRETNSPATGVLADRKSVV